MVRYYFSFDFTACCFIVLTVHAGVELFRQYLKSTFCEENLAFWEAIERLRACTDGEVLNMASVDVIL